MLVCPLCLKNRRRLATECKVNFDINETVNFDVIWATSRPQIVMILNKFLG